MSLNIFFHNDIRNALLAADEASSMTACAVGISDAQLQTFRQGYRAALTTVALAFGLSPDIIAGVDAPPDDTLDALELPSAWSLADAE